MLTIFDKIYEDFGYEKLEQFLDAVKVTVSGNTIEFHLDCYIGHVQMSLDMSTPRDAKDVSEVYETLWKHYTYNG